MQGRRKAVRGTNHAPAEGGPRRHSPMMALCGELCNYSRVLTTVGQVLFSFHRCRNQLECGWPKDSYVPEVTCPVPCLCVSPGLSCSSALPHAALSCSPSL